MDRRIEDRGGNPIAAIFGGGLRVCRRSGQERRKHDMLAEATGLVDNAIANVPTDEYRRDSNFREAIRILITMMERRK